MSAAPTGVRHHSRRFAATPAATLDGLTRAAEDWGASFERNAHGGGRLELPVNAGLRQGRLTVAVRVEPQGEGSELGLTIEREEYQLATAAVGLLLSGALGATSALLWPFFPRLAKLAPFGAVLAVGVWFLVLAKLRYVGAEVFLDRVADQVQGEGTAGGPGMPTGASPL